MKRFTVVTTILLCASAAPAHPQTVGSAKANPEPALHLTTDDMNKGTVSDLDARRHYLLRADPPSRLSSRRPWKPSTRVRTGVLISIEKRRCNRDCNPCWKTAGVPPQSTSCP